MVYRIPGTPEIQVDDAASIILFQHGIDREGGLNPRSALPPSNPGTVTQFPLTAIHDKVIVLAGAENCG
ncbi:hypothetical protein M5W68_13685 [Paenibacillus larvae]|uniref:hypothetical protein n=1 Tax=Paenibacillus larvae TaxID=1464 RepID=UPI0022802776|nr:hypothetical protein [Paenibacillus larvae]MCY9509557.1 hypothetical protein [Paenibacillus larvae]MCY9526130.1 hypothetical protein [Paenibacillus larvae]